MDVLEETDNRKRDKDGVGLSIIKDFIINKSYIVKKINIFHCIKIAPCFLLNEI